MAEVSEVAGGGKVSGKWLGVELESWKIDLLW